MSVVIAGAGIAGLVLGYKLSQEGHEVLLVEKEDRVGGLARSFSNDGFIFDIGPHRFHSDLHEVNGLIREVLEDDCLMIDRSSGVRMFGSYFDWPLGVSAGFKIPHRELIGILGDLFRKRGGDNSNFEQYIIGKYGRTLYEVFFKGYTEKFLQLPCDQISRDWAVTGIDRAVIEKKAQFDDLFSLAKSVIRPRTASRFIYPESGGMQQFCELLRQKIEQNGGTVLLNSSIDRIEKRGGRVAAVSIAGVRRACRDLVWTAPHNELLDLLDEPRTDLDYLALVLFNYRIAHEARVPYQWCYFSDTSIPFNRVSLPTRFNPALAPSGASGLCVELTCRAGDTLWNAPEGPEAAVRRKLREAGLIKKESDVIGYQVERIRHAYPIYDLGYREKLDRSVKRVGRYGNVRLLGRTGAFWYNNMDHSIEAALTCHRELTGQGAGPQHELTTAGNVPMTALAELQPG